MKIKHKALIHYFFVRYRSKFLNNKTVRATFEWLYRKTRLFNTKTLAKYDKYSGRNDYLILRDYIKYSEGDQ